MNQLLLVSVLQCISNLFDIRYNSRQWDRSSFAMKLTQSAIRGVTHNQERDFTFHAKVQNPHDIGMLQAGNDTSFRTKLLYIVSCQLGLQDFDGGVRTKVEMLSQVDLSEATFSQ